MRNTVLPVLVHGILKRCPQCGKGKLYARWNVLHSECSQCGCEFERRGGDTWFFTYMTTAFLTGIIVLWMFLYPITNHLLGQTIVVVGWFVMIVLTLPHRKGIAIAIDYILDERSNIISQSQTTQ